MFSIRILHLWAKWSSCIYSNLKKHSHRTLIRYIRSQELNGKPLDFIKNSLEEFVKFYNEQKPHTSLKGLTPMQAFNKSYNNKAA